MLVHTLFRNHILNSRAPFKPCRQFCWLHRILTPSSIAVKITYRLIVAKTQVAQLCSFGLWLDQVFDWNNRTIALIRLSSFPVRIVFFHLKPFFWRNRWCRGRCLKMALWNSAFCAMFNVVCKQLNIALLYVIVLMFTKIPLQAWPSLCIQITVDIHGYTSAGGFVLYSFNCLHQIVFILLRLLLFRFNLQSVVAPFPFNLKGDYSPRGWPMDRVIALSSRRKSFKVPRISGVIVHVWSFFKRFQISVWFRDLSRFGVGDFTSLSE